MSKGTCLSLTIEDKTVMVTDPFFDHNATDILESLVGLMVAHTWLPESVYEAMRDLANEHLPEENDG